MPHMRLRFPRFTASPTQGGEPPLVALQGWRGLAMKRPLFIQSLSAEEKCALEAGLRSRDAFTLRRAQILLASARGDRPLQIAT